MKNKNQTDIQPQSFDIIDDDVDFIKIAKTIWNSRKIIIISVVFGTIIGLINAITVSNEFTASTVMVPQMSNTSKSQLGGLAALAGFDLGMTQSSELSPIIYPKIVNSVPFKLELMNAPLNFKGIGKPISLYDYYTKYKKPSIMGMVKKYTFGLPGIILNSIRKKNQSETIKIKENIKPLQLTLEQHKIKRELDQIVSLEVEKKEGYLTLTVRMPEPLAAAQLAEKAQEILQRDIIKFKVEKSKADLDFIQQRYDIAKANTERYQLNVAVNTDRFKNLTSSVPQIGTSRIQSQYAIANNVFLDLAKQLEQAKIQVKKDTPVFTIVEPVVVPNTRSKPNRPLILVSWIIVSVFLGISIVYGKIILKKIKLKWNNEGA